MLYIKIRLKMECVKIAIMQSHMLFGLLRKIGMSAGIMVLIEVTVLVACLLKWNLKMCEYSYFQI
jgi:hypothetical protein